MQRGMAGTFATRGKSYRAKYILVCTGVAVYSVRLSDCPFLSATKRMALVHDSVMFPDRVCKPACQHASYHHQKSPCAIALFITSQMTLSGSQCRIPCEKNPKEAIRHFLAFAKRNPTWPEPRHRDAKAE